MKNCDRHISHTASTMREVPLVSLGSSAEKGKIVLVTHCDMKRDQIAYHIADNMVMVVVGRDIVVVVLHSVEVKWLVRLMRVY